MNLNAEMFPLCDESQMSNAKRQKCGADIWVPGLNLEWIRWENKNVWALSYLNAKQTTPHLRCGVEWSGWAAENVRPHWSMRITRGKLGKPIQFFKIFGYQGSLRAWAGSSRSRDAGRRMMGCACGTDKLRTLAEKTVCPVTHSGICSEFMPSEKKLRVCLNFFGPKWNLEMPRFWGTSPIHAIISTKKYHRSSRGSSTALVSCIPPPLHNTPLATCNSPNHARSVLAHGGGGAPARGGGTFKIKKKYILWPTIPGGHYLKKMACGKTE